MGFKLSEEIAISIIIPIYNVEKYLRECLDSILNQTFQNFEIICVDDGSTDKSLEILEEYKNRDERFILLKQEHEGAELSALKGGIETIKKYRPQLAISIYHSDDDFINIPMYLYDNLENYEFRLGHYSPYMLETILYAIPEELA